MGKTSSTVKDRWNKKAYDSVLIRLKKGSKKIIEEKAKQKNESLNYFIVSAIENKIKKLEEEKFEELTVKEVLEEMEYQNKIIK